MVTFHDQCAQYCKYFPLFLLCVFWLYFDEVPSYACLIIKYLGFHFLCIFNFIFLISHFYYVLQMYSSIGWGLFFRKGKNPFPQIVSEALSRYGFSLLNFFLLMEIVKSWTELAFGVRLCLWVELTRASKNLLGLSWWEGQWSGRILEHNLLNCVKGLLLLIDLFQYSHYTHCILPSWNFTQTFLSA